MWLCGCHDITQNPAAWKNTVTVLDMRGFDLRRSLLGPKSVVNLKVGGDSWQNRVLVSYVILLDQIYKYWTEKVTLSLDLHYPLAGQTACITLFLRLYWNIRAVFLTYRITLAHPAPRALTQFAAWSLSFRDFKGKSRIGSKTATM